jgi:hypothetical protein
MLYRETRRAANFSLMAVATCLTLIGLMACARTASTADNPDGVDPPEVNPHPKQIVTIRVLVPSSLKVALSEEYIAPSGRGFGSAFGPGLCSKQKDPNKPGIAAGHSMPVPIALTGRDGDYIGTFTVDRFLPGRCEWGFMGLRSNLKEDTPVLYGPGDPIPTSPHGPEQVADIWCADNPIPTEPSRFICTSLMFFEKFTKGLPEELIAAHPHDVSRGPENIIFMDDTTKSIVLRYHDLKAEAEAARSKSGSASTFP